MKVLMSQRLSSDEVRSKTEATNMEKYGTKAPAQNKDIKKKSIETNLERYGVEHSSKLPETQNRKKKTNLEKYGVEYATQSEKVKVKAKETSLKHYGVTNPSQDKKIKEKKKKTVKEHYGVENPMQSEELKEKAKQTNLKRYNVEHPAQADCIQEKTRDTVRKKYNCDYVFQSLSVQEKINATNLERYGTIHPCQNEEIRQKTRDTMMERYGVPSGIYLSPNSSVISKINIKFAEMLYQNNLKYRLEFPLENYFYDIKIENSNILIEIDPTITHNSYMSIFDKNSKGKDPNYHLNKSNIAKKYGYYCINVFDWDEWNKVLQLVQSKEYISIKDCDIKVVDNSIAEMFEDKNYINGSCKNQTLCYGLYYKNELICLMSFSELKDSDFQWKLICMCTKNDISVDEGYLKLFNRFINDNNPDSIITYCDNSKFNGKQFIDLKMKFYKTIEPIKYWSKDSQYISDDFLNNYGYKNLFEEVSEKNKEYTNEELMLLDNWLPVYDCGQTVYTWNKS